MPSTPILAYTLPSLFFLPSIAIITWVLLPPPHLKALSCPHLHVPVLVSRAAQTLQIKRTNLRIES